MNIPDHIYLHANRLSDQIQEGNISTEAVVEESYRRLEKTEEDHALNTFITTCEESAYRRASKIDQQLEKGINPGPLTGVPVAVKDNICTKGIRTTCASKMLEQFVPPYDATVIEKLRNAGAIIVGKTNMDEFAMGSSGENSAFGHTKNPRAEQHVPGGSSSGSAASVASGVVPVAIGSDTGGSIRQPASFCGITGCKPTYGHVSRYGLVAFASSLDQIGPLAHRAEDCRIVTNIISGKDQHDMTTTGQQVDKQNRDIDDMTVGVPEEFFGEGVSAVVQETIQDTIETLSSAGVSLQQVSLPHTKYGIATYYLIACSEASSNLGRYDGTLFGARESDMSSTRTSGFGKEVKRRILLGTFALSEGYANQYYRRALKVRRLIKNDFEQVFEQVDLLLGPTSPTPPFRLGEKTEDPLQLYESDALTVTCNLAGLPGISVPCSQTDEGLPIGLQIIAPAHHEPKMFQLAEQYETDNMP